MTFNPSGKLTVGGKTGDFLGDPSSVLQTAQQLVSQAQSLASAIGSAFSGLQPPTVNMPNLNTGGGPTIQLPSPTTLGGTINVPAPNLSVNPPPTPYIPFVALPFTGVEPTLAYPTPPNAPVTTIPAVPAIAKPTVPTAPSLTLPATPNLLTLNIQPFNGTITLPAAPSTTIPDLVLAEPTIGTYTPGSQYTSSLLQALQASLESRIGAGGTGLDPAVEQAIWDRARERELKTLADALDDLDRYEALGYAAPPGVHYDARLKLRTEYGKVEAGLSRDIAIKQAELTLENVKHALTTATQLESQLMDYVSRIEQRIFDWTKYAVEAAVSVYRVKVEIYTAQLEAFKTRIAVYEATIRGELAKVELYKAQLDAERIKADVNTSLVAQYKAQIDAALSQVEVYKVQLAGVQTQVEIERLTLAVFEETVKAQVSATNAFVAQVEGYKAQVQAETSKLEGYRTSVEAYKARMEADAKAAGVLLDIYSNRIEAYKAEVQGEVGMAQAGASVASAQAAAISANADAYKAQAGAVAAMAEIDVKRWQATIDLQGRMAEVNVAAAKASGELYISARALVLEASKVAAQVAAQLGAAALNAFNWSNSISYAESDSFAQSNSWSESKITSLNISP